MRLFKKNDSNKTGNKFENIVLSLQSEKRLINVKRIAEQFYSNEPIIEYQYKDDILYIINEEASIYHIVHSTVKLEKLALAVQEKENKVMFDIGANVGLFGYFYKKRFPNASSFLFEPDEKLLLVIEKNMNRFDNYQIINSAISNYDGEVDFFYNPFSSQTNSTEIEALLPFLEEGKIKKSKISCRSLASFCDEYNIQRIDTLKIDIQGGEYKALVHSKEMLKNTKEVLVEICFLMPDTIPLVGLMEKYYKNCEPINDIIMGADLKFFN